MKLLKHRKGQTLGIVGIIATILMVAIGSAVGLIMLSQAQTVFTVTNSYTTGRPPYVNVIAASHEVAASGLVTFNETHPATIGTSQAGQAFKISFEYPVILTTVSFKLNKTGVPTGNLTAILYAFTGTYGTNAVPTGSALDTSAILDIATGLTTTSTWKNFTFSGGKRLEPATAYCIAVTVNKEDNLADAVNVQVAYSNGHAGNRFSFKDNAYVAATTDTMFVLYGDASLADISALRSTGSFDATMNIVFAVWPLLGIIVLALIAGAAIAAVIFLK